MKPLDARQWCVAVDDQSLFFLFMRILLILVAMSVIGLMVWAMRWLAMQRAVRSFFVIPLLLSIVFPFYSFLTTLRDFAHNQYARRFAQMEASPPPDTEASARYKLPENPHFGLWKTQLSGGDSFFADAYRDAVRDGYRLGHGYDTLWWESLALDGVLFLVSVMGLATTRKPGFVNPLPESQA